MVNTRRGCVTFGGVAWNQQNQVIQQEDRVTNWPNDKTGQWSTLGPKTIFVKLYLMKVFDIREGEGGFICKCLQLLLIKTTTSSSSTCFSSILFAFSKPLSHLVYLLGNAKSPPENLPGSLSYLATRSFCDFWGWCHYSISSVRYVLGLCGDNHEEVEYQWKIELLT